MGFHFHHPLVEQGKEVYLVGGCSRPSSGGSGGSGSGSGIEVVVK